MSASDLKDVKLFSKPKVFTVVTLNGGPWTMEQKTPVDKVGGKNLTWDFPMQFNIDEAAGQQNRLMLVFQLRCKGLSGDKVLGEARVPVKALLDGVGDRTSAQCFICQLITPSGKPKGVLNVSFKLGEIVTGALPTPVAVESVMGYPAPVGTTAPYQFQPPPPPSALYPPPAGYPPPGAPYVYAPPAPGYPYPPMQQPSKKS